MFLKNLFQLKTLIRKASGGLMFLMLLILEALAPGFQASGGVMFVMNVFSVINVLNVNSN